LQTLASLEVRDATFHCCLIKCISIGQFTRLLPALAVGAVSQAPSPESNPNSLLPVKAMVSHYLTIKS